MKVSNYIVRGNEQAEVWMLGDRYLPLRETPECSIALAQVRQGSGAPPHIHRREDEGFYILEGEVTFLYDDRLIVAGKGDFVWGNRGVIHCFTGTSAQPATMLLIATPSSFASFVRELARPVVDPDQHPGVPPELIEKLMRIAPGYGIEMRMDHVLPTTVVKAAGPSQQIMVHGERLDVLATGAHTAGQLAIASLQCTVQASLHRHDSEEMIYVARGKHEVEINGERLQAGPNDLIVIPAGAEHRISGSGDLVSIFAPAAAELEWISQAREAELATV